MIERDRVLGLYGEGIADRFDLSERLETIGLGELLDDRRALLRPSSRREDQQYAEGGAGRDGKREKAIHISSLAIEDCHAVNDWQKKFIGSRPRFLCIFMLLNSACRVSGLFDWHGPPQGRFVRSIASVSSPRSTTRLTRTSSTSQADHPW